MVVVTLIEILCGEDMVHIAGPDKPSGLLEKVRPVEELSLFFLYIEVRAEVDVVFSRGIGEFCQDVGIFFYRKCLW